VLGLLVEPAAAGARQRVELCAAPELAHLPFSGDPAGELQLVKRRIERPVTDLKLLIGDLLEPLADRPWGARPTIFNSRRSSVP
jgi:hypothetical protein